MFPGYVFKALKVILFEIRSARYEKTINSYRNDYYFCCGWSLRV